MRANMSDHGMYEDAIWNFIKDGVKNEIDYYKAMTLTAENSAGPTRVWQNEQIKLELNAFHCRPQVDGIEDVSVDRFDVTFAQLGLSTPSAAELLQTLADHPCYISSMLRSAFTLLDVTKLV